MIKKITLIFCTLFLFSLSYTEVLKTDIWKTSDIENFYINNYLCNKFISSRDCKQNKSNLRKLTGFNFDEKNFWGNIKSVKLSKISYTTKNSFPNTGEITSKVSGLIILPKTEKPKGVILYYHPTVFDNSGVPSNITDNRSDTFKTNIMFDTIYTAIYAARGYIVVAPDYIGQGDDYNNYHPYILYPKQNVNTAVDLLNNVAETIRKDYNLNKGQNLNLYSVGYSEGASYSVWTAKCLQSQNCSHKVSPLNKLYTYRAAVGLSGAYDISNTTLKFIQDNNSPKEYKLHNKIITSLLKPSLVANTFINYMHFSNKNKTLKFSDFDQGFLNMKCSIFPQSLCNIDGKNYTLKEIFNQKALPNEKMVIAIFNSALYKKYPNQKSASHYGIPSGNNSMYDLFNEEIFNDSDLIKAMQKASITDFSAKTETPIFIFTLKEDSVVTRLNYENFMKNANSLVEGYILDNNKITSNNITMLPIKLDINDVDHITGEIYANIFAYKYINKLNNSYS